MRFLGVLVIAFSLLLCGLYAEESGGVYFLMGAAMPTIENLNSRLDSYGYAEIPNQFISYGFGVHFTVKERVLLGFEWATMSSKEKTSDDGTVKEYITSSSWFVDLGYIIVSVAGFNVYPYVGIGSGEMILTLSEVEVPAFDNILEGPTGITRLSTGGFLLNPSLGLEYNFNNIKVGLRGGYTFDPFVGKWKIEDSEVSGGPDEGMTGPYVNILLGFGS